jgi:hypothetical protein
VSSGKMGTCKYNLGFSGIGHFHFTSFELLSGGRILLLKSVIEG